MEALGVFPDVIDVAPKQTIEVSLLILLIKIHYKVFADFVSKWGER